MAALLFFEHGLSRMFGFPIAAADAGRCSALYWFAGAIELVGGALVALGLFTRVAALIMSGEMAFAYFLSHAPHGFFPILNRGDGAILYCFMFLYFAFAGAGAWSLDALMGRKRDLAAGRAGLAGSAAVVESSACATAQDARDDREDPRQTAHARPSR